MNIKESLLKLSNACDEKFKGQFEFKIREISLKKIAVYLHKPKDSSSLAVTRILFGLAMVFDIPDERGGAMMERRWGDPKLCHFPLLPCLHILPMPYMALVYAALWLGAVGIMLGYKYRLSSAVFVVSYWYLLLIEKSYWNNHSYLFGLVGLLLACTDANCFWSIDAYLDPSKWRESVPYWNYFVLKYQFFILYFMAGLKKGTVEWLSGYSVQNLSEHWVFGPFKLFFTVPQIDYLVVHWFIFAFDLTVTAWMMWSRSRNLAMVFCALFNLMNSRLFRIGMFPWVCLATMPLFYPFDWPKIALRFVQDHVCSSKDKLFKYIAKSFNTKQCTHKPDKETENQTSQNGNNENGFEPEIYHNYEDDKDDDVFLEDNHSKSVIGINKIKTEGTKSAKDVSNGTDQIISKGLVEIEYNNFTTFFILLFVVTQAFLPYSHFITKGYNNWTNGLYGYSWDMMVHTWESHSTVVKVINNDNNAEFYIDPYLFTPNDRWTRHGDMIYQYAQCLEKIIIDSDRRKNVAPSNISIFIDVWCSMNGRFVQRMFDPKVDLLKATWSPFAPISYLMPLLDEALHWRTTLDEIREKVNSWSEFSDVTFFADFPGYDQEKFIPVELKNVTLTVLDGVVAFEGEVTNTPRGHSYKLVGGNSTDVASGMFHKVINIGKAPAFYMYTYYNSSEAVSPAGELADEFKPKLPIGSELRRRFANIIKFGRLVIKSIMHVFRKYFNLR